MVKRVKPIYKRNKTKVNHSKYEIKYLPDILKITTLPKDILADLENTNQAPADFKFNIFYHEYGLILIVRVSKERILIFRNHQNGDKLFIDFDTLFNLLFHRKAINDSDSLLIKRKSRLCQELYSITYFYRIADHKHSVIYSPKNGSFMLLPSEADYLYNLAKAHKDSKNVSTS